MGQFPKWYISSSSLQSTALLNQYVIVRNMLPHPKNRMPSTRVIRGTAAHMTGIVRNGPLGADGWEMPVLLPEFFGGAHACRDFRRKSVTSRVVSGRSRSAQGAPRNGP